MGASEENKAIAEAKKKAGNDAFAKKDLDDAVRLYSEAIELDPSSYIYRSNRSACYALQGKHKMAKEEAEACIKINPDFTKGYYRLATAQTEMGEVDAALETVKAGLGRDPRKMFLSQTKEEITALLDAQQEDKSKSETQLQ
ncbi:unnamed protein product, partial [Ectocarpus fasciculatus]